MKACARLANMTTDRCHYTWCRQHKACVERPGTVVKLAKPSAGPTRPGPDQRRKRVKAKA